MTFRAGPDEERPYFLWDTEMTSGQLRERLRVGDEHERLTWMGRILREARYQDVWKYLSVHDVLENWSALESNLGRRTEFWRFLLTKWRELGLVDPLVLDHRGSDRMA